MKIAYLADTRSINGLYRGFIPMKALLETGRHTVIDLFDDRAGRPRDDHPLDGVDVLVVHRFAEPWALELVQRANAAGAAVVWDNDDDLGAMPRSSVTHKRFGGIAWERRLRQMRQIFRVADLATAPTAVLTGRFERWGAAATQVIENYVSDECLRITRRPRTGTTIGWIAGLEHAMDAQQLPILDDLQRILDERPDVRVLSIGLRLGLRSHKYGHVEQVPLKQIGQAASELDIAIAPIVENDFNRARSNVKLKEYAAGGTPWLASPIGPYEGMGERQGGRLVPDDGWHGALTSLIDKPRERRKLAKRAARWGAGEAIAKNVGAWEATLQAAIARRRSDPARAPRSAA